MRFHWCTHADLQHRDEATRSVTKGYSQTDFPRTKHVGRPGGLAQEAPLAIWSLLAGVNIEGYDIHVGRSWR